MTQGCNQNNKICGSRVDQIKEWTDEYKKRSDEYIQAYKIL